MKILVIDDERAICAALKRNLQKECFEVDCTYDGARGLYLARTNTYDLIILDYGLPKKEGREVCREIRQDAIPVPILMLSVQSSASIKTELLNLGADDYLVKPFSFQELLARIRALLRRPTQLKQETLGLGGLEVDTVLHVVRRDSREIYLTKKEYMLLEYLIRNQGITLSQGSILEHVWDASADPFSNTIEVHISKLRKKIDQNSTTKLIHTVPGRGYQMRLDTA